MVRRKLSCHENHSDWTSFIWKQTPDVHQWPFVRSLKFISIRSCPVSSPQLTLTPQKGWIVALLQFSCWLTGLLSVIHSLISTTTISSKGREDVTVVTLWEGEPHTDFPHRPVFRSCNFFVPLTFIGARFTGKRGQISLCGWGRQRGYISPRWRGREVPLWKWSVFPREVPLIRPPATSATSCHRLLAFQDIPDCGRRILCPHWLNAASTSWEHSLLLQMVKFGSCEVLWRHNWYPPFLWMHKFVNCLGRSKSSSK